MTQKFTTADVEFLLETIKEQKNEIKLLKERIDEIIDTAIHYSKNNIKLH